MGGKGLRGLRIVLGVRKSLLRPDTIGKKSTVAGNLFKCWVRLGGFGICELMGFEGDWGDIRSWVNMLVIFFCRIGRMLQLFMVRKVEEVSVMPRFMRGGFAVVSQSV